MIAPLPPPITTVLIRSLCGCVGPRDCQMVSTLGIFLQLRACDLLCGTVGGVFAPCLMHSRHKVPQGRCQTWCRPHHHHSYNHLSSREAGSLTTLLSPPSAKRAAHHYCYKSCHLHCLHKLLFQKLRQDWRGKIHKGTSKNRKTA